MLETLLWYSRYSVWVGAIVLLLQAITGRSIALITLLSVLLLGIGFLVFVGVLSWEGLGLPLHVEPATVDDTVAPQIQAPARPEPARKPSQRRAEAVPVEAPPKRTAEPDQDVSAPSVEVKPSPAASPVPVPEAIPGASAPVRLSTQALTADSPLVGASCSVCARRLKAGQVVARCPECGAVQHASCWTDNGFACGVEDCHGRGSLEAPAGT